MATAFPIITTGAPAGLRWTQDAANKAAEKGLFIRVGFGAKPTTKRALTGAKRSWANTTDPEAFNTIFNLQYRLTGTPEAVARALELANKSPAEIQQALANSISRTNFESTMAAQYNQEIAQYEQLKKTKAPAEGGYEISHLLWLAEKVGAGDYEITTKAGGVTRGAAGNVGPRVGAAGRRGGATQSIADKVQAAAAAGRSVDVSDWDPVTGRGLRLRDNPKSIRSGRVKTENIPIQSNNIDKYIQALRATYGADADTRFAAEIAAVRRRLSELNQVPAAAAGVAVALPQTAAVPGATLAPAPQFTAAVPALRTPGPGLTTVGGAGFPAFPRLTTRQ